MTYDYRATDHAFTVFLNTTPADKVLLEQTTHFTEQEWRALAHDRRHE